MVRELATGNQGPGLKTFVGGVFSISRRVKEFFHILSVSGVWLTESLAPLFPGCLIRRLSTCICLPRREGGHSLSRVRIRKLLGCCKRHSFCPKRELDQVARY